MKYPWQVVQGWFSDWKSVLLVHLAIILDLLLFEMYIKELDMNVGGAIS